MRILPRNNPDCRFFGRFFGTLKLQLQDVMFTFFSPSFFAFFGQNPHYICDCGLLGVKGSVGRTFVKFYLMREKAALRAAIINLLW